MKPYALNAGEGEKREYGIPHVIKLGEFAHGRGAAVFELDTCHGEEPPVHTHRTEDEIFYIVSGSVTFHCDGQDFPLAAGGFMFLPKGMKHGYTINGEERAKLLIFTFKPSETPSTWDGYIADVETQGTLMK